MKFRAAAILACLLIPGEIAAGAAQPAPAPGTATSDCAPPANFAKRFPTLTEKKALGKVNRTVTRQSYGLLQADNPVTGAEVDSNDLYAQTMFGVAGFGRAHTYTAITQPLDGPRAYSLRISDTEYTKGTRPYFSNDLAELHIPHEGGVVVVKRTAAWEEGFCSASQNGPPSCYNTAIGAFGVERELFEALAARDPKRMIEITARKQDGTMAACPYYFSPLSFKATMLTIDAAYAKAVKKAQQ